MSEVKIVSLDSLGGRGHNVYEPFIQAALIMPKGSAVLIERTGVKGLNGNVNQAISARNLRDKLAVIMRNPSRRQKVTHARAYRQPKDPRGEE